MKVPPPPAPTSLFRSRNLRGRVLGLPFPWRIPPGILPWPAGADQAPRLWDPPSVNSVAANALFHGGEGRPSGLHGAGVWWRGSEMVYVIEGSPACFGRKVSSIKQVGSWPAGVPGAPSCAPGSCASWGPAPGARGSRLPSEECLVPPQIPGIVST